MFYLLFSDIFFEFVVDYELKNESQSDYLFSYRHYEQVGLNTTKFMEFGFNKSTKEMKKNLRGTTFVKNINPFITSTHYVNR